MMSNGNANHSDSLDVPQRMDRNRSRLTRGPLQFWRLERICFTQLSFAKIALALRLNEEPDSIRERLRWIIDGSVRFVDSGWRSVSFV